MARGSIYLLGQNPDFRVLTDQIFARNDHSGATLIIPFKIEFTNLDNNRRFHPAKVDISSIKGILRSGDNSMKCAETVMLTNHTLYANKLSFEAQFQFFIPQDMLSKLENSRTGDPKFNIDVIIQTAIYGEINFADNSSISVITELSTGSGNVSFQIAQSMWVKNLLPQMGYETIKLIELPSTHKIVPEEYAAALEELEKAKQYFVAGDYDKCAGHCRVAIESFRKRISDLKKFIESNSEYDWMKNITTATSDWLEKCLKSTYELTSKPHHPKSFGHFSRKEAEAVFIVTSGIIYYISITGFQ